MKLKYGIKEKPGLGKTIIFAFQQLLAILAATIAVPMITNGNAGLKGDDAMSVGAALFGAGVGTLVYVLFTRAKSPVFLGSSFAFLGSMAAAFLGASSVALGYMGLLIGALFAGIVYVVIAIIVKFAGVDWIDKLMPAVVIGPTVAIIGLSLAGNAIGDLQTTNAVKEYDAAQYQIVEISEDYKINEVKNKDGETETFYVFSEASEDEKTTVTQFFAVDKNADLTAPVPADQVYDDLTVSKNDDGTYSVTSVPGSTNLAILCGLITFLVVTLCSVYGKKMAKLIPFIIGIVAGFGVAAIFTLIGNAAGIDALKIADFSKITGLWGDGVGLSTFISIPNFTFLKAFGAFGELDGAYIGSIALAYIPVAFVVFAEHLADHKNISSIIETDLLKDPGLHNTLLGDGVGSMAGAFFGGCPNTTYGESIGCVAITGNASVITIICTAVLAILISFVTPIITFLSSIPSCVMGGVCMSLYGFIAVSGLKMVQKVDLEDNRNLFTVSAILIAGIGGLALHFGKITITDVACALILGIIVNLVLSCGKKKETKKK